MNKIHLYKTSPKSLQRRGLQYPPFSFEKRAEDEVKEKFVKLKVLRGKHMASTNDRDQ